MFHHMQPYKPVDSPYPHTTSHYSTKIQMTGDALSLCWCCIFFHSCPKMMGLR